MDDDAVKFLDTPLTERSARGLARAVGQAVRQGKLEPGAKLPPIRAVATQLGLSPATVHSAWAMLARSGVVHAEGRRGTTVAETYSGPVRYSRALEGHHGFKVDLSTGTPDLALLPSLEKALADEASNTSPGSYLDEPNVPELIEILHATWPTRDQEFMIVDGAMDAMDLVTRTTIRFGDRVIVGDPGFPMVIDGLQAAGAEVVGVKLDAGGMLPGALAEALAARPTAAVYMQPRAHNPTGISLSSARAQQLARIIGTTPTMVVEDDSAGDVASTPPISLGAWLPDQTIHVRSYSKSHGPDLRLAAMSGPPGVIREMRARRHLGQGWTSRLLQRVLLNLLTHPVSVKAVEFARKTYQRRRQAMVRELAKHGVRVTGTDGFNIWVPVVDETSALVRLASQGIAAAAGAPFAVDDNQRAHIRVTISTIDEQCQSLASMIAQAARSGPRMVSR